VRRAVVSNLDFALLAKVRGDAVAAVSNAIGSITCLALRPLLCHRLTNRRPQKVKRSSRTSGSPRWFFRPSRLDNLPHLFMDRRLQVSA